MVSEGDEIKFFNADQSSATAVTGLSPLKGISDAAQVDYDASAEEVIWADTQNNVIVAEGLRGGHRRTIVRGFTELQSLAVDWIGKMVYFSDHDKEFVGVASLDGRYAKIVQEVVDATSMAVDPANG